MFASKDLFFSKPSGYQISRSVRTRASATASFTRAVSSNGSLTTWTWSGWVKRGALGNGSTYRGLFGAGANSGSPAPLDILRFTDVDTLQLSLGSSTVSNTSLITTQVFRDPSAWYHIVLVYDSTNATSSNRAKLYVNGSQITAFGTATYPAQNTQTTAINVASATTQVIGGQYFGNSGGVVLPFDGYMTEVNFIDGQALTPSSFGQTNTITGVWQPLKYTGTYGTNGFYLNFSDNSNNTATTIGKDYSGNGNNWTPNNISVTAGVTYDSMLDVPTLFADGGNGRGNYCTLNPANNTYSTGSGPKFFTLTNGNLTGTTSAGGGASRVMGTVGVSSGKWYAEATIGAASINASADQGLICVPVLYQASSVGGGSGGVVYIAGTGQKRTDAGSYAAYGSTYTTGDVIGVALDMDSGTVTFYKNNVSQGVALSGLTGSYTIGAQANDVTSNANYATYEFNFGQRPFTYTPPTGFVALNTQNLPTPTISNGANYMAATTYTGTGSALTIANTVNGISFQPDFVWVKGRSGATDHALYDSVRGTTKDLVSNSTAAETTQATGLTAFGSTGFTVGALAKMNTNAATYVGWQWLAGTTSSSNTAGSITSTVSVNATAGFSVVTWTGNGLSTATIGHGLGVQPSMVITKSRSGVNDWWVAHKGIPSAWIQLNTTGASGTGGGLNGTINYQSTYTSTVFGFINGSSSVNNVNQNAVTYVAYCFSEVAGYSKFGSYTGNGSADGAFVFCGFRPRYVLLKRSDTADAWVVFDSVRGTYNLNSPHLQPHLPAAEADAPPYGLDFLSNGFKCRASTASMNASGGTYIFMAFAENPTKFSLAR